MFNIQDMMRKAQEMQGKLQELQDRAALQTVSAAAASGLVRVTMTCKGQVQELSIDPSLIKVEDKEMLEDLLKVALNDARRLADEHLARETEALMGGMGPLAGKMKLPF